MIRRLPSNRSLFATLAATWLACVLCLCAAGAMSAPAHAASGSTASPAVNAAVQEAIAKAKAGKAAGENEGANGKAFSKLTGEGEEGAGGEEEGQTTTKTANNASTNASKAPSTGLVVLVFAIAALLLGGIAFYIVRDARGVAPVPEGLLDAVASRNQAARARKRRTKAKAARQARKRNR